MRASRQRRTLILVAAVAIVAQLGILIWLWRHDIEEQLSVRWCCHKISNARHYLEARPHVVYLLEDPHSPRGLELAFGLVGRGNVSLDYWLLTQNTPWQYDTNASSRDASREKHLVWLRLLAQEIRDRPDLLGHIIDLNRLRMPANPFGTAVLSYALRPRDEGRTIDELVEVVQHRLEEATETDGPDVRGTKGSWATVHQVQLLLGLTDQAELIGSLSDETWVEVFRSWYNNWYLPNADYVRFDRARGRFVVDQVAKDERRRVPEESQYVRPIDYLDGFGPPR